MTAHTSARPLVSASRTNSGEQNHPRARVRGLRGCSRAARADWLREASRSLHVCRDLSPTWHQDSDPVSSVSNSVGAASELVSEPKTAAVAPNYPSRHATEEPLAQPAAAISSHDYHIGRRVDCVLREHHSHRFAGARQPVNRHPSTVPSEIGSDVGSWLGAASCAGRLRIDEGDTNFLSTGSKSSASRTERDASTRESQPTSTRRGDRVASAPSGTTSTGFPVSNKLPLITRGPRRVSLRSAGPMIVRSVQSAPLSHRVTDASLVAVFGIDIIAAPRGSQQFLNFPGCLFQVGHVP